MSAKQYDCPACGREMVWSDAWGVWACSGLHFTASTNSLDAIERRTIARIAEAEKPLVDALEKARKELTFFRDREEVRKAIEACHARADERGAT